MGRPTKLTPEVTKTITDAIAIGATYQAAAEYAGVGYRTFGSWMKRHADFRQAIEQANARAKIALLAKIQQAEDWRSKAWILERRFPAEYGPTVNFGRMSDDELRAFIAARITDLGGGTRGGEPSRFEVSADVEPDDGAAAGPGPLAA